MRLIYKVLRQHISISQLVGFLLSNVVGLTIILLGWQFYQDVTPMLQEDGGLLRADYLVVNKPVSTLNNLTGGVRTFSPEEVEELRSEDFVRRVAVFTPARFEVSGYLAADGLGLQLGTQMFFEAVPDDFVDVTSSRWHYAPGESKVPVIIPRDYLALYNFGFAESAGLPVVSEEMISRVQFRIRVSGNGRVEEYQGRIIGFSSRLNTILVPQSFMDDANARLANASDSYESSRLIVEVTNPTDSRLAAYMSEHGYCIDADKLQASKTTWFLSLLVSVVMIVGLVICALACYILVLSVLLLLQKNTRPLQDLSLLGYTPRQIAQPYTCLVVGVLLLSWMLALCVLWAVRSIYIDYLLTIVPNLSYGTIVGTVGYSLAFVVMVIVGNVLFIRARISNIA